MIMSAPCTRRRGLDRGSASPPAPAPAAPWAALPLPPPPIASSAAAASIRPYPADPCQPRLLDRPSWLRCWAGEAWPGEGGPGVSKKEACRLWRSPRTATDVPSPPGVAASLPCPASGRARVGLCMCRLRSSRRSARCRNEPGAGAQGELRSKGEGRAGDRCSGHSRRPFTTARAAHMRQVMVETRRASLRQCRPP